MEPGHDQPAVSDDRITEIDGLRAVAMTIVVAHHCGLLPFGWVGVWIFFVISGYVISRKFMRQGYSNKPAAKQYVTFISRRFWRIVPVYLLYLSVCADSGASRTPIPTHGGQRSGDRGQFLRFVQNARA